MVSKSLHKKKHKYLVKKKRQSYFPFSPQIIYQIDFFFDFFIKSKSSEPLVASQELFWIYFCLIIISKLAASLSLKGFQIFLFSLKICCNCFKNVIKDIRLLKLLSAGNICVICTYVYNFFLEFLVDFFDNCV